MSDEHVVAVEGCHVASPFDQSAARAAEMHENDSDRGVLRKARGLALFTYARVWLSTMLADGPREETWLLRHAGLAGIIPLLLRQVGMELEVTSFSLGLADGVLWRLQE